MTRLSLELQRLYLPAGAAADAGATTVRLADADGRLRALVLDLHGPADWTVLAPVWQGVQAELDLPAPGIAVSGTDGLQLWFALREPVDPADARSFLQGLVRRWLPELPPRRLRLLPGTDGWQPSAVPALQGETDDGERWSAFVAADLAPMFSGTPWLDVAPNPDGQAALLARLQPIAPDVFRQALQQLQPLRTADAAVPAGDPRPVGGAPAAPPAALAAAWPVEVELAPPAPAAPVGACTDPRAFLLDVMNNDSVPMALRIEAAKALLPGR